MSTETTRAQHTQGPWTVTFVKGSYQRPALVMAGHKLVAECPGDQLQPQQPSIGEAEDNARLIAEAPAMLAELGEMLKEHAWGRTVACDCIACERRRAILARIEGGAA